MKQIHFIGIGGIGISALARLYLAKGYRVSGSDLDQSATTQDLEKLGAKIFIGHRAENIDPKDTMVIHTVAVPKDNPELKMAKKLGIKTQTYAQALGDLTKKYFTIAISGTHGKSTTTSMLALLLEKAGLDPTVIVGTKLKEWGGSNCRVGKSKYLLIEADEYTASFLNYWPKILVLTNIEADHLDYYKNLGNILKTFKEYIGHLPKGGVLIVNGDDRNISKLQLKAKNYSLKQAEAGKLRKILKVPGEHNVYNALAALSAARALKIPDKISFKALSEYKGAWRRFEESHITWNMKHITIISDYGHHPTKVRATLEAAREKYPRKKIWCVYQPHQEQRTYYLFKDFVKVFREALTKKFAWAHSHTRAEPEGRSEVGLFACDKLIITDIFDVAGREISGIKKKVSSEKLVKAINKSKAIYLPKDKIMDYLKKNLQGQEVLIIMGAGDIYNIAREISGLQPGDERAMICRPPSGKPRPLGRGGRHKLSEKFKVKS